MLFRSTSLDDLFGISKRLWRPSSSGHPPGEEEDVIPSILLLCHFCRIAQAADKLLDAAKRNELALFELPLSAFLRESDILPRGRGNMQFLIACEEKWSNEVANGSLFSIPLRRAFTHQSPKAEDVSDFPLGELCDY